MKRILSLSLTCALACIHPNGGWAQTQGPGTVAGVVLPQTGVISGTVSSSISGRRLSGITMVLVNAGGVVVGKTQTTGNGEFRFPAIGYDTYTLQCVASNKVIGTSSVPLTAPARSVDIVCTADAGYWKKWGVATGLGAAAVAIGAAGIVATRGDASGSR